MKKLRSILSVSAIVFAIAAAVAGNASSVFFTTAYGDSPVLPGIDCNTGTLVDTSCGIIDQNKGICSVRFAIGGTSVPAFNDPVCGNLLYRQ